MPHQPTNIAFKEWAAVCAAVAAGRQMIVLRKGGIHEGREGFRVEHDRFWLLPTRFHQDATGLQPDAERYWHQALAEAPPPGTFRIDLFAHVLDVFELREPAQCERLADRHILSADTVAQRFHYRQPGLFVLVIRAYRLPAPFEIAESSYIAGCKSWVELPEAHSPADAAAVLDDQQFAAQLGKLRRLVAT